jgi:hypothetical protein
LAEPWCGKLFFAVSGKGLNHWLAAWSFTCVAGGEIPAQAAKNKGLRMNESLIVFFMFLSFKF